MFHLRQTAVSPSKQTSAPSLKYETEIVYIFTPSLKFETETVYIATPSPKFHTEIVYIREPASKQQVSLLPPPVPLKKYQTKNASGYIPPQKYKTTAASTSVSSPAPVLTNVYSSKNGAIAAPTQGSSPVTYGNKNKDSEYRYRNKAAAAIPKKCPCIAKVLAGLIIGLMLVAAILVPLIIGLIKSTTTTTITSTTASTATSSTTSTTTTETTTTTGTTTTTETTTTSTFTSSTSSTSASTTVTTKTFTTSISTSTSTTTSATITTITTSSTSTSTTSSTSTSTTSSSTSTTSTTGTTTTTTASVPLTLIQVQKNLDPTSLPSGWTLCYNDTYNIVLNSTLLQSILTECNKGKLLLGCRSINSTILTIAAMGLRSDVLFDCGNITTCTHVANGVGWYYSSDYSWGFVENTDTVNRVSCDTDISSQGTPNPDLRLCWHTSSSYGGYRCGTNIGLNSDTNFVRVIYHVD